LYFRSNYFALSRKISIPTNYDDITLGQVMRYNLLPMSPIQIVKNFCEGDVDQLELDECEQIAQTAIELLDDGAVQFNPFLKLHDPIEQREIEFGFVPDINRLSVGEMIDLEAYCANPNEDAHKALAILYRPIAMRVGKRYKVVPYNEDSQQYNDLMKSAPYSYYAGSVAFFLTLISELEPNTDKFFQAQMSKLMKQGILRDLKNLLETSGDGTIH